MSVWEIVAVSIVPYLGNRVMEMVVPDRRNPSSSSVYAVITRCGAYPPIMRARNADCASRVVVYPFRGRHSLPYMWSLLGKVSHNLWRRLGIVKRAFSIVSFSLFPVTRYY